MALDLQGGWCFRLLRVPDGWAVLLPVESELLRSPPGARNPSRRRWHSLSSYVEAMYSFGSLCGICMEVSWRKPCSGHPSIG
ncbi:UNVERIFIED_CONTAM: hypothetical protein Slati_2716400 [Sesamum latifolium]|uniref:Uncharacterized protein n=1 Tax=Sesamum latifolium TaxID=2727402 RepID=A0AAW2VY21_9LAMI